MNTRFQYFKQRGFTIVELTIVIVVISILSTIVVVAYNGVQASSRDISVLSDLDALDGLETQYGLKNNVAGKAWYSGDGIDADLQFKPSPGNFIDIVVNGTDYCIRGYNVGATKNSISNAAIKESTSGICATLGASLAAGGSGSSGVPNVPTGLAITSTQSTQANLSWNTASGATGYTAQCAANVSFSSGLGTLSTTAPVTSGSITSLTPGTGYCRVKATNVVGSSAWTSTLTTIVPVNPIGWWKLNGNATDSSANGFNGTTTNVTSATGQNGSASGAYSFAGNGTTSVITIPTSSTLNTSVFSMSAWIKPQNSTLAGTIIGSLSDSGPQLRYSSSTNSQALELLKQGVVSFGFSTSTTPLNSWAFMVATYDSSNSQFTYYLNGTPAGSGTNAQTFSFTNYQIGRRQNTTSLEVFNGVIDDVRIYSRILPSSEVSAMYSDGAQ